MAPTAVTRGGSPLRRLTLALLLVALLALGLWGYTTPSMRMAWESVATMCGF